MAYAEMAHDIDPADKLLCAVGDLSGFEIFHNQVLVAVYQRPEKTKSGLYLAKSTLDEDQFQSKIGLILRMGPQAFEDTGEWRWPHKPERGAWIVFRPSEGWALGINGILCRMLADVSVKGRIASPDLVW